MKLTKTPRQSQGDQRIEPDHTRYNPATDTGQDFLYTQVSVTPIPQCNHILTAAAAQRADDRWTAEDHWALEDCTSIVATRHMQGQSGMHAYITGHDGDTARLVTLVPKSLSERPYDDTYLRTSEMRPLTEAQATRLPELTACARSSLRSSIRTSATSPARSPRTSPRAPTCSAPTSAPPSPKYSPNTTQAKPPHPALTTCRPASKSHT